MKRYIKPSSQVPVEYGRKKNEYGKVVDYMSANVDGVELYSEFSAIDELEEDLNYLDLKNDILDQAEKNGISYTRLHFWYD